MHSRCNLLLTLHSARFKIIEGASPVQLHYEKNGGKKNGYYENMRTLRKNYRRW